MDKILSIACAVLLTFMTVLVRRFRFSPAISSTARRFFTEACPLQPDLDRLWRSLRLLHPGAHGLTLIRDKFTGKAHTALLVVIDGLILLMAIFVHPIGGAAGCLTSREVLGTP